MSGDGALTLIDVGAMRGLEIGPLYRPKVSKQDGSVFYVDYYSTEELRHRYAANEQLRPFLDDIVDVDYVIKYDQSLHDATADGQPFDYVIASHVIEHVPNPLRWMADAAKTLRPGGVLSLVVPDKRYCFDVNRVETQMRDWIDWYLRDATVPTSGQLFDFFANVVTIDGGVDTIGIWNGTADYRGIRRPDVPDADRAAFGVCEAQQASGEYIDVHASVYTPQSFLSLLETSARLGLLDFHLGTFCPTEREALEFFVSLKRLDVDELPGSDAQIASIQNALDSVAGADRDAATRTDEDVQNVALSERELRIIEAKRRVMETVRAALRSTRRRLSGGGPH